jgi:hypothetical protein
MPDTDGFMRISPAAVDYYAATEFCILCRYMFIDASSVGMGYGKAMDCTAAVSLVIICLVLHAIRKPAICQTSQNDPDKACLDGPKHVLFSQDGRQQNQAYYYHPYCWEYVIAQGIEDFTCGRLLRLARSSNQLFCLPGSAGSGSTSVVTDVAPNPRLSDKQFKNCLKRFREKLPPDLQGLILDYAGICPASSILRIVYAGTMDLLQRVVLEPNHTIQCPIARHMKFNFVFIEDSWLWCGCTTEIGIIGYPGLKSIPAEIPSDVNMVKFTIGRFGIQGLQFRGPGGASIPIGEFQESLWTGQMTSLDSLEYMLLGLDVRQEHTRNSTNTNSAKGLKVRNLKIDNRQKPFGHRFMWKGEIPLSATIAVNSKAYYQNTSWVNPKYKVNGFPGWHLIRHLPLLKHRSVFYGITAYCTPTGATVGLESHFRCEGVTSSSSIGRKKGCAIYFALADSEYFDTAWALCDDIAAMLGPFLVVRTASL